jgi:regulator of sigma E protease
MSLIVTIFEFLIVIAVLVFVHELGHFLFAKWCGVKVDEFAIGFGPKIFNRRKGETLYRVNLFPLGGYVKIVGENPDDPLPPDVDKSRVFSQQNRFKQFLILFAGVLFNLIFAYVLYAACFMIGLTVAPEDFSTYSDRFKNERIIISEVTPNSPADKAGMKLGYVLKKVYETDKSKDSANISKVQNDIQKTESTANFQEIINHSQGRELTFEVSPKNSQDISSIKIHAEKGLIPDRYAVGIAMNSAVDLRLPFFSSIKNSFVYTNYMIENTVVGLYGFFHDLVFGKADLDQVSGPVGIAKIVHMAGEQGISTFLMIIALISINLAVINLLPFPALDGGRILFVAIESIARRQIHTRFQNIVNIVGFSLLMALMVIVSIKDIIKLFK